MQEERKGLGLLPPCLLPLITFLLHRAMRGDAGGEALMERAIGKEYAPCRVRKNGQMRPPGPALAVLFSHRAREERRCRKGGA